MLSPVAACFLLIVYGPVEQYFANVYDFSFDIYDLLVMLLPLFLAGIIALFLIFALSERISRSIVPVIIAGSIGVFIATFVQGTFFARNLPLIDGHVIDWNEYAYMRPQSMAVWICSIVFAFAVLYVLKNEKFLKLSSYFGGGALVFLLLSLIIAGFSGDGFISKNDVLVTRDGIEELSGEQNFIILLVDAVDADAFDEVIDENPELASYFDGFTFFKNSVSCYGSTAYSIPQILSGEKYLCQENYYLYLKSAFQKSELLGKLENEGYRINVFYQDVPRVYDWVERFNNISADDKLGGFLYPVNFVKTMLKLSGIKYFPYDLKTRCNVTPVTIASDSEKIGSGDNLYTSDLIYFYENISGVKFSKTDEKVFSFIYLDGAHRPLEIDGNLNRTGNATYKEEVTASIKTVGEYIDKVKEAGVFDESVIIVLADHGFEWRAGTDRQNPLLLVKANGEKGIMRTDERTVSYNDLKEAFFNLSDGQTASEAFDFCKGETARPYYYTDEFIGASWFEEYMQYGYADDLETMKKTGVVYSS